jgi:hypothetical protein
MNTTTTLRLRKVEAGVYETADSAYQVQRNEGLDEWDVATAFWTVEKMSPTGRSSKELHEAPTKRACVEWLAEYLAQQA